MFGAKSPIASFLNSKNCEKGEMVVTVESNTMWGVVRSCINHCKSYYFLFAIYFPYTYTIKIAKFMFFIVSYSILMFFFAISLYHKASHFCPPKKVNFHDVWDTLGTRVGHPQLHQVERGTSQGGAKGGIWTG